MKSGAVLGVIKNQHDQKDMCRGRGVNTAARADPPPEFVWAEPHGVVTHEIDPGAKAVMPILVHRIGTTATRP
jgi:hypothetical protein